MIKVNGKTVTNPIEKAMWAIFALFVTWSVFIFVALVLILVFGLILSPFWLPAFFVWLALK